MAQQQQRRKPSKLRVLKKCSFCIEKKEPALEEYELLGRYVSERGRILARGRTGACGKHQRKIAREIKRARFLSLLP